MFMGLKGEVAEIGATEFNGKEYPFVKVYTKLGTKVDLVRVGLAKLDGIKVGEKVDWVLEVKLAENDNGKGRLSIKRSE